MQLLELVQQFAFRRRQIVDQSLTGVVGIGVLELSDGVVVCFVENIDKMNGVLGLCLQFWVKPEGRRSQVVLSSASTCLGR